MPRVLPVTASDEDIRKLVVEWLELVAKKKFAAALEMFEAVQEGEEWTPEFLENWLANYGYFERNEGVAAKEVTSLFDLPDPEAAIAGIEVDRENLYGLDPELYVGMVHYEQVPLDGSPSDLTALFHIMKVGDDGITLELLSVHVM